MPADADPCPLCGAAWGVNAACSECKIARKVGVGKYAEQPRPYAGGADPDSDSQTQNARGEAQ